MTDPFSLLFLVLGDEMPINLDGPLSRDGRPSHHRTDCLDGLSVLSKPTPPYFDSIFLVRQAQAKGIRLDQQLKTPPRRLVRSEVLRGLIAFGR